MNKEENKPRVSKHIKNLYLDPNNYRFVDNSNYKQISDIDVTKENIQKRTRNFIEGDKQSKIKDLVESLKTNGYLKVDMIQVTDLGDNKYLIIEGNRRVAALKYLQEQYEKGVSIGKLDSQLFKSIPFEIHDKDKTENHLIIMGLKHISGNKKWAAINQSQLIYDYLSSYKHNKKVYQEKEDELSSSLAITKQKLRTSQSNVIKLRKYNLNFENRVC